MSGPTFLGNPVTINGALPAVGSTAPDFRLTDKELNDLGLQDFKGKKRLLNIVPSLDTDTCATSTRKFNEFFAGRKDAVALIISADLPFAQGRFCGSEGLENVVTLSMMRDKRFAEDYGVLIQDSPLAGLATRAVVVIDEDDQVVYTELVSEIADEPDYDRAMAALG